MLPEVCVNSQGRDVGLYVLWNRFRLRLRQCVMALNCEG